jgi:HlyD family secretion protein
MRPTPLLLLALLAVACKGDADADAADEAAATADAADAGTSLLELPVVGQEVVKGDLVLTVTTRGEIKSDASAMLKAETGGLVQEVLVRAGDRVRQGQPLVRLDPEPLELALAKAEAALNAAKINYRVEIDVDSIATGQPPSDARREFVTAKAGIPTAEVNLREAKLALERSVIRAPFDGVLERVNVAVGERISSGADVAMIVDLVNLRIEAQVQETDIPLLRANGEARVTVAALPGTPVRGRITAILPMVDSATRAGTAVVRLRGDGMLRPGMYVDVELEATRLPDRIIVPDRAVIERDGRPMVFVVREGRAKWEYVNAGRSNRREREILPDTATGLIPLNPGDIVLIDGHLTLSHDAPVKLVATRENDQ